MILVVISRKHDADRPPISTNGIKLEDILAGRLNSRRFNGTWTGDSDIFYKSPEGHLLKYDVNTKKSRIVSKHEKLNSYLLHELSADGKYVLLAKIYIKLYRHSFLAQYDILNVDTGVITELRVNGNQEHLLLVEWGPVGNALIFNYDKNLYYKPSVLAPEIQLTNDEFLNGIPDCVDE